MTETAPARQHVTDDSATSIVLDEVQVSYSVYEDTSFGLRSLITRGLTSRRSTEVHAVRGVSLSIDAGEVVGVIGSNGSGKSTLLRAIAGLEGLSGGSIRVRGEVGLLGVGAALMPTLSGRRNVVLGGLALGLSHDEVMSRLPEVVEFSGLGDAINRPLRTYSSGMRARLAFSIATLRTPDILLIDEALAVGDKDFRRRSLKRLREIGEQAGTVLLVTHNMREIRRSCTRVVWLNQGQLMMDGDVDRVLDAYDDSES